MEENLSHKDSFHSANASVRDANKIIRSKNPNKATGPDKIPRKSVKLSTNVITKYFL